MLKVQSQSTTNPCSISQWAAVEALIGPQDYIVEAREAFPIVATSWSRRLNAAPGSTAPTPEGAFYVFPPSPADRPRRRGGTRITTTRLRHGAARAEGVAVVLGTAFGLSPAFRVSYAASDERCSTPRPAPASRASRRRSAEWREPAAPPGPPLDHAPGGGSVRRLGGLGGSGAAGAAGSVVAGAAGSVAAGAAGSVVAGAAGSVVAAGASAGSGSREPMKK